MESNNANYAAIALQLIAALASNRASRREAKAQKKQGNLAAEEAELESQRQQEAGRRLQSKQSLAFLKSGVSLQGSPLLVLQDTERETNAQAASTRRAGSARRRLLRDSASNTKARGTAGVFKATGSAAYNVALTKNDGSPKKKTTTKTSNNESSK